MVLLAKPLGLLMLAYPVWVLASLKIVHFDQTSIAAYQIAIQIASIAFMAPLGFGQAASSADG